VKSRFVERIRNAVRGFNAVDGPPSPDSDYWYQSRSGFLSQAGTYVSPDTAMRLAAVYACVRVISETIASLPIVIYRHRQDGGKERANQHPLYDVLQNPNVWQTGFEFWEMMEAHLDLRGNAFAEIVSGNGRAIDQLIPFHPDRVRVFRLPNGRLRYEVSSYSDGSIIKLAQDQMLHLRGLSSDGIVGMSTIAASAEVMGTGLAQQQYAARFFANDATPSMTIESPVKLTKEARENLKNTWREAHSGANAHQPAVLEMGLKANALGLTNRDSQLLEARQFTRTEISAVFRVPPHKIGDLTRGTFSNIEQQNIEFATDSIRPRLVRMERRINRDLIEAVGIGEPGDYFAEWNMDSLLRGDMKSRYEAYAIGINAQFLCPNDARRSENLNPVDGLDTFVRPVNMAPIDENGDSKISQDDAPPDTEDDSAPDSDPAGDEEEARSLRLREMAVSAAGRVVRREVKGLRRLASRSWNAEGTSFAAEVADFYTSFTPVIAEILVMSENKAKEYAQGHSLLITTAKAGCLEMVIDGIEEESPATLASLALGESIKGEKHEVRKSRR
jgi:HK97 family phage portal protein